MRVLTLGAGAIGGYFGGRLSEGDTDVTFLVREARKRYLAANGLRIESQFGNYTTPVKAITKDEIDRPYDVVLLTCKAYDLPSAMESVRPAVGAETAILPLLNGLAHIDALNAEFGAHRVLGGIAKIAATLTPGGVIKHLNDWHYITFGEQSGELTDRVKSLKAAFDRTPVIASAVPDIMQAMWEKIVHLTTVAGMTCMMRASVGEISRVDGGSEAMIRFLQSNSEIADREGFRPSEAFMLEFRKLLSDETSAYTASMLRDLERGGPVEADHILGFMLGKARHHGLDDTLHRLAFLHVKAYEQRRAACRL
ncbi:MAG: ketopantoate reductase family protein [bacterium]|nr:ketopantoate reductase family protein [bacterium]